MGCIQSTTTSAKDDDAEDNFSPLLHERARSVISTVAVDAAERRSLSVNSLRAAASAVLDVNEGALDNISKLKDEISSNPDLLHFVKQYLESSIDTLRFFTALKDSLQKALKAELLVREAVVLIEDGHPKAAHKKLRKFMQDGNPFTERFFEEFMPVVERQISIREDLLLHKQKLDRKLRKVKAWRTVWDIVYNVVSVALLIFSVMVAAVVAPHAVIAAAVAASGAMARLQQWVDLIWDEFQSRYEGERDVINPLTKESKFAFHELNNIMAPVEQLDIMIKSMIEFAEFAIKYEEEEKEEAALKFTMVKINLKLGIFVKSVVDLENKVDQRAAELKKTTATILETMADSIEEKEYKPIPENCLKKTKTLICCCSS